MNLDSEETWELYLAYSSVYFNFCIKEFIYLFLLVKCFFKAKNPYLIVIMEYFRYRASKRQKWFSLILPRA